MNEPCAGGGGGTDWAFAGGESEIKPVSDNQAREQTNTDCINVRFIIVCLDAGIRSPWERALRKWGGRG